MGARTAEEEIAELIEVEQERRESGRRRRRGKKTAGPGEKCLYSWTCGPRNDGRCPYSATCADWRRPLVPCTRCVFGEPSVNGAGLVIVKCKRTGRPYPTMPVDGYCSEGELGRFQDAARYLR